MVGESSSKSKTAGSICIRWKIRRKLGELRTSGTVLKFRNWKLETLRRRPTACICRSLKETAFLFVTSLSFLRRSLEIYAGNPSHRDSTEIQLSNLDWRVERFVSISPLVKPRSIEFFFGGKGTDSSASRDKYKFFSFFFLSSYTNNSLVRFYLRISNNFHRVINNNYL